MTREELHRALDMRIDRRNYEEITEGKARDDEVLREVGKYGKGAYWRNYYADNKERISEYQRRYYQRHKEQIAQKHKEYYAQHREEIIENQKRYAETHKEQLREYHHERYLRKKQAKLTANNGYRDRPYTRTLIEEGLLK